MEQKYCLSLNEHGFTRYHMRCHKCKSIGPAGSSMDDAKKLAKNAGWRLEPWPRCNCCQTENTPE